MLERPPDFFILGAPKAATTELWAMLDSQPDICMSEPKEPRSFLNAANFKLSSYLAKFYGHYAGEAVVGDACPRNLFFAYAINRIAQAAPQARFIVMHRDPAARLYSHWWDWTSRGGLTLTFREFFEQERAFDLSQVVKSAADYKRITSQQKVLDRTGYAVECGLYGRHLSRAFEKLDPSRFLVIGFERFIAAPQPAVDCLRTHLGLVGPGRPVEVLKENEAATLNATPRPPMCDADRLAVKAYYAEDTAQFECQTARCSTWL